MVGVFAAKALAKTLNAMQPEAKEPRGKEYMVTDHGVGKVFVAPKSGNGVAWELVSAAPLEEGGSAGMLALWSRER